MNDINIKNFAKKMLKTDYDIIMEELLPLDKVLFTEKYINGKTNKDLKMSSKESKILDEKLIKIISKYIHHSLDNISETQLKYRCKRLNKSEDYINFCVDAFIKKLSNKNLSDKYFLTIGTVKQYKILYKKELTTKF